MPDTSLETFMRLVSARRGHFRLESGHHSPLWLDLDRLFADSIAIDPFVNALAERVAFHNPEGVCGPLLGGACLAQLIARRLSLEFFYTERHMPSPPVELYRARYRLPASLSGRVRGKRVALVDDVMSAGSALRGTDAELRAHGARPVVAGALLLLGLAGAEYFSQESVPVESIVRDDLALWLPGRCPLCEQGVRLEDVTVKPQ
jgi:orotate phosphoribosyltransferase